MLEVFKLNKVTGAKQGILERGGGAESLYIYIVNHNLKGESYE